MRNRFHFGCILSLLLMAALAGCGGATRYTLNITVEGQGTVTPASGASCPAAFEREKLAETLVETSALERYLI